MFPCLRRKQGGMEEQSGGLEHTLSVVVNLFQLMNALKSSSSLTIHKAHHTASRRLTFPNGPTHIQPSHRTPADHSQRAAAQWLNAAAPTTTPYFLVLCPLLVLCLLKRREQQQWQKQEKRDKGKIKEEEEEDHNHSMPCRSMTLHQRRHKGWWQLGLATELNRVLE